ncbi:MAG: hypothetical protein K0R39_4695, partial [Symbiobacteriaceae bacterium]|nr:hypothetical protein [Symbiobacteriaceae bacterium]
MKRLWHVGLIICLLLALVPATVTGADSDPQKHVVMIDGSGSMEDDTD